jgi:hypothetical protein
MRIREARRRHLRVEALEGRIVPGGGSLTPKAPHSAAEVERATGEDAVLPANARLHGYSLTDMTLAAALFDVSGNNLQYYPNTPFQILYYDPKTLTNTLVGTTLMSTGSNSFTVAPGTPFFVPLWNADDSPPIVGKFPTEASQAADYFFNPDQLGGHFEIIVDGQSTPIGRAYVAGPVTSSTPLPDGGGSHIITVGVFLHPLSVGTHTVTIRGGLAGTAVGATYLATNGFNALTEDITYTIHVVPHGQSLHTT